MIEFLEVESLIKPGKKYEEFYRFTSDKGIKYKDLFVVLSTIGFRKNTRKRVDGNEGVEFRASYFSEKDKLALYTILLNDKALDIEIKDLFDKSRFLEYKTLLIEYAAGGLEYIVNNYLPIDILDNPKKKYTSYDLPEELLKAIYQELNVTPF